MQCRIAEVDITFVEHGAGAPLLVLHGAGVDHRETEAALEAAVPTTGYRRIYVDLPGMGASTADGLNCNDDVVALLVEFIAQLGAGPVALLGHSYGAYLARGVAARSPEAVAGLAMVCPIGAGGGSTPDQQPVRQDADAYDELPAELHAGFDEYFVVRTGSTAVRYRDSVVPGTAAVDESALERIFGGWPVQVDGTYAGPTLIVAGRRDSTAGYADAVRLLENYPCASLTVLEDAGHALMHERPELFGAVVADWLRRTSERTQPIR